MLWPLVGKTSSYVKDSRHFVEILSSIKLEPEDDVVVSFDVASLFTSVSLKECYEIIRGKLVNIWMDKRGM